MGAVATRRCASRPGAYTARVNWGDRTPLAAATVTAGTAPARIAGGHTYAGAGTYTIRVTVDDGVTSTVATTTVRVG